MNKLRELQKRLAELETRESERKKTEEALRESEKRLKAIFDNAMDGILVADGKSKKFIAANKMICQMLGYRQEEITELGVTDIHPEEDLPYVMEQFDKQLRGGIALATDIPVKRKNGSVFYADVNSSPIMLKRKMLLLGIFRDITERKRAEEALRESERWLSTTLRSIGDAVITTDVRGYVKLMNPVAQTLTSWNEEDAMGKPLKDVFNIINEETGKQAQDPVARVIREGVVVGLANHTVLIAKDGTKRPIDDSGAPIRDDKGNIAGVILVFRDITERKRAEEEHQKIERLESIGTLAGGIAHEINNPLVGVLGFSQILLAGDSASSIRKELTIINDNAQRVANIVKNVLSFANPKTQGKESTDINSLIRQVLEIHAYQMKINNIEFRANLMTGLPWTSADYNQIQQVLLNIIVNAVEEMKRDKGKGKLIITTKQIDSNIQILVSDNGPGISKKDIDKIFNPFFTTKDPGEGTGLGLSISYSIIKEHHGRLYARNNQSGGATFIIELPITSEPEKPDRVEADADEKRTTVKARILVIDDEPSICRVIKHVLSDDGNEVETISDAAVAFERLREKRYNLILVDIKMPGMDGIEFYNRLPEIAVSLQDRVMFMTGDSINAETRVFLRDSKAIYIGKPFEIKQLKQLTNKALIRAIKG